MDGKPGQDYLADFAAVGADPGCSSAQLQAAWRRRVSELHPDRAGGDGDAHGSGGRQQLVEVNGAYRRLRRFQRLHGRMPGAVPEPTPALEPEAGPVSDAPPLPAGRTWILVLFNLALLCLLATVAWLLLERAGMRDRDAPVQRASLVHGADAAPPGCAPRPHRAPLRNSTTSTV